MLFLNMSLFLKNLWFLHVLAHLQKSLNMGFSLLNPNPPDPLPLLAPANLFAIPFSTVWESFLDQVSW